MTHPHNHYILHWETKKTYFLNLKNMNINVENIEQFAYFPLKCLNLSLQNILPNDLSFRKKK